MSETVVQPAPTPEYLETMFAAPAAPEAIYAQGEAGRIAYLASLPTTGFEGNLDAHQEVISQVAAIGFPVDNVRRFAYRENGKGRENVLASWGIGSTNYGEFTVHTLLGEQHRESRLATYAHESTHANTPLDVNNAEFFGGEAERREAAEFVFNVAEQSLLTDRPLDGYHKMLAERYRAGTISHETFVEETSAILSELAITNRAKLTEVQEQQHQAWDDEARIRRVHGLMPLSPKVDLLSKVGKNGEVTVAGIDKTLIKLLDGVDSYGQLINHLGSLKSRFYSDEAAAVAQGRFEAQNQDVLAYNAMAMNAVALFLEQQRLQKRLRKGLKNPDDTDDEDDLFSVAA